MSGKLSPLTPIAVDSMGSARHRCSRGGSRPGRCAGTRRRRGGDRVVLPYRRIASLGPCGAAVRLGALVGACLLSGALVGACLLSGRSVRRV